MTKKFSNHARYEDYDDYADQHNGYHDEIKARRRMKKMKNAIKSKNIDYLMDLDEDY